MKFGEIGEVGFRDQRRADDERHQRDRQYQRVLEENATFHGANL
jgi:hypothetical protein